tara:strand:- start:9565 stop:10401 length:837 start_codon:yes stop_codon:yes gene_type:complete
MRMIIGIIRKMLTQPTNPVSYWLPIGQESLALNELIGSDITLQFTGNIYCIECGRKTKKSFNQGHCFPCLRSLAACDTCIVKPETCHYEKGTCREPEWGEANCMRPHVIYVANTSGLKVGITRASQVPTRWIDQGAIQAMPMFQVESRLQSGLIEVVLKNYANDRTEWRKMLRGDPTSLDLIFERKRLYEQAKPDLLRYQDWIDASLIGSCTGDGIRLNYPVINYPETIKSHNFDKHSSVSGCLQGIKGQYMIFDNGVLNIRKFGGYELKLSVGKNNV